MRRAEIVLPFIQRFIHPQSVIDVGCGAGGWLKVWKKNYHADIYGIDGAYVDKKYLLISDEEFHPANLEERLELNKKFDLAECIEVAEHISPPPICEFC